MQKAWILYHRADYAAAQRLSSEAISVARNAGDPHILTWSLNALGVIGTAVGPLDEAAAHLTEVHRICKPISAFRMQASAGGVLARVRLRQGRVRQAADLLKESIAILRHQYHRCRLSVYGRD